jgi:membrane protein required for colicin V production
VNWVDLVLLCFFAFALHVGYQKGFIRQIATMSSLVAGIHLATRYHAALAQTRYLAFLGTDYGENTPLVLAYVGIFAAVILTAQVVASLVRRGIQGKALEQVDNFFGGCVGLVKVYVACGLLAVGIFQFLPREGLRRHFSESYLAPRIAQSIEHVLHQVPLEYRTRLREFVRHNRASELPPRWQAAQSEDRRRGSAG